MIREAGFGVGLWSAVLKCLRIGAKSAKSSLRNFFNPSRTWQSITLTAKARVASISSPRLGVDPPSVFLYHPITIELGNERSD
jgi:hypothetical protein